MLIYPKPYKPLNQECWVGLAVRGCWGLSFRVWDVFQGAGFSGFFLQGFT